MSEWLLKMFCTLNFNMGQIHRPSASDVRQSLLLWARINTKFKIKNPVWFDEYLGLGVEVTTTAELPVFVNGVPIHAVVFSPNSEASHLLYEQGEDDE